MQLYLPRLCRWQEAIECMKRAQMGSDPAETAVLVALANLYDKIGDITTAASYHRKCIEISQKQNRHLGDYAKSCVYVAQHEYNSYIGYVAEARPIDDPPDLAKAKAYLEPIVTSNVEEVQVATELLRKIRAIIG
jgi:anaphase-promoting complex subunit 8